MNFSLSSNRAFYLLLSISIIAFFLLISLLSKITPLTLSHTIYFCQQAMQGIGFTLPHSFPSLLGIFLTLVISSGFFSLIFQIMKTQILLRKILKFKVSIPGRVNDRAKQLGIAGRIDIVKTGHNLSFCYGLLNPRICLSSKMIKNLSDGELKAVLMHESYHLKNRDPLKILLSKVAVSTFFFVPILRDFHKYFILSKELAADKLVIKTKLMKNLKTALTKSLGTPPLSGIAPFASESSLEQRVNALTLPNFQTGINVSLIKSFISILVFIFAFAILNLPVHAMENGDGTHSYYIMSQEDMQIASCLAENTTAEFPFSSQESFSPLNYSPKQ